MVNFSYTYAKFSDDLTSLTRCRKNNEALLTSILTEDMRIAVLQYAEEYPNFEINEQRQDVETVYACRILRDQQG